MGGEKMGRSKGQTGAETKEENKDSERKKRGEGC